MSKTTARTAITTLRQIERRLKNVAEAASNLPAGEDGNRWVTLTFGVAVRISDLRALADGYKQLQKEINRRAAISRAEGR